MNLPLEDLYTDVISKARRGIALTESELATAAGLSQEALASLMAGQVDPTAINQIATVLGLHGPSLLQMANGHWQPAPIAVNGLACFNTVYDDMTVNAYLIWDPVSKLAAAFDTGATAQPMVDFIRAEGLTLQHILLTHTHADHVADISSLLAAGTAVQVWANQLEPHPSAQSFKAAEKTWQLGQLSITARDTNGHSAGGTTFVIAGLGRSIAIVGDAIFASSMGGAAAAFRPAKEAITKHILSLQPCTVLCPGHGPLTTVAEEAKNNPFFATTSPRIGFVGVGKMGANMARRLVDGGYNISAVYDLNQTAATALADELQSTACISLAQVTAQSDVIFTVVTNDAAMRAIFFNPSDNLLIAASGKTFVNCATLSPAIHRELYAATAQVGAASLEACMASSISHAREGKLYLMVAGDAAVHDQLTPVLDQLSISRRYIGSAGRAAEVKALVNMVMNINTAALAEGLGLASALGHDLDMIRQVFSQTGANSRVLETDSADMVAREHDCWFSAEHAAKDSGIAAEVAQTVGLNLPLNQATLGQYQRMVQLGLGDLDKSGIAELTFLGRQS